MDDKGFVPGGFISADCEFAHFKDRCWTLTLKPLASSNQHISALDLTIITQRCMNAQRCYQGGFTIF